VLLEQELPELERLGQELPVPVRLELVLEPVRLEHLQLSLEPLACQLSFLSWLLEEPELLASQLEQRQLLQQERHKLVRLGCSQQQLEQHKLGRLEHRLGHKLVLEQHKLGHMLVHKLELEQRKLARSSHVTDERGDGELARSRCSQLERHKLARCNRGIYERGDDELARSRCLQLEQHKLARCNRGIYERGDDELARSRCRQLEQHRFVREPYELVHVVLELYSRPEPVLHK